MKLTFEKNNFVEHDSNKKNLLITLSQIVTREYTYGYVFPLIEYLKDYYNIYTLFEGGKKQIEEFGLTNVYRLNKASYNNYKATELKRKKELETSDIYNQQKIDESIELFFKNEPHFDNIIIIDNHNLMLPFNPYSTHPKIANLFNDYFDSFDDNDSEVIQEIERINHKLFNVTAKSFSPLAFRYMYKNVMLSVIQHVSQKYNAKIHGMIMDPSAAIPFFKYKKLNYKYWYFTDDKRHLRELHKSPIAELQHLVYEPHWKKIKPNVKNLLDDFDNQKIPFFFAGSLLNDKGLRKYIWKDFFKDFKYDGSELYFKVSLIYGMDKDYFEELKSDVEKHPNFKGDFLPNEEYLNVLKRCKTAFIARNVSANLGLTYRHIQYLYFGVLPIFDYLYDSDYLWIPQKFQDKLAVKNAEELIEKVNYYNTHENERLQLLTDMQNYFQINDWLGNWKEMLKNTDFIKELIN